MSNKQAHNDNDQASDKESILYKLINDLISERRSDRRRKLLFGMLLFGIPSLFSIFYAFHFIPVLFGHNGPDTDSVAIVRIEGEILSSNIASADKVVSALRSAFEDKHIKAIALSIDSPGGAPVEAERITRAIAALKKANPKPVVAVINNAGASAAYMIALHADKIYAGRYSLVGSIGAVMTGWDFHKVLEKVEVKQRIYASGPLKSMFNPFTEESPEAAKKARQMVDNFGKAFVDEVRATRGPKLKADFNYGSGEVWSGKEALDIGLIDEIGTIDDVITQEYKLKSFDYGPRTARAPFFASLIADVIDKLRSKSLDQLRFQ